MPSPAHDPSSNSTPNYPTSVNGSTTNNTPNDDSLSDDISCSDFIENFAKLGHHLHVTEADINEWFAADVNDPGYEHLDDAGIIQHVLRQSEANDDQVDSAAESDEEPEETVLCVNHKTAMEMLDKCIAWLHSQPEATPYNTSVLPSLKEIAAKKKKTFSSLKQTTLTSFIEQ